MTTVLTDNANYTAIAGAIREKLGVQTTYLPSEMAEAIASIEGGGGEQGTYYASQDGTLGVEVFDEYYKWYFNGYTKTASDVTVSDSTLAQYVPSSLTLSKAYGSDKSTVIGWIGFYNGKIRSWTPNQGSTLAGTFWGVLYVSKIDSTQENPYEEPPSA